MKQLTIWDVIGNDWNVEEPEYSETTKVIKAIFETQPRIQREALRLYLSAALKENISDRKMRALLEIAKSEGFVIGNNQDGRGYYIPETLKELELLYRQNANRAFSILKQQKYIKKRMNELR